MQRAQAVPILTHRMREVNGSQGQFFVVLCGQEVIFMDKKALRAEIKAKKRAMTEAQIAATSEALAQQLYAHPA